MCKENSLLIMLIEDIFFLSIYSLQSPNILDMVVYENKFVQVNKQRTIYLNWVGKDLHNDLTYRAFRKFHFFIYLQIDRTIHKQKQNIISSAENNQVETGNTSVNTFLR